MIRVFKANDTNFSTNGEVILKPNEAIISKNIEEEYIELECPLKYADFLIQDNILIVDTLTGVKGYKIHNPVISNVISVTAWKFYQTAPSVSADRGVVISHGKNLDNCKITENWDDVVTTLIPVGHEGMRLPEGSLSVVSPYQKVYEKSIEFDVSKHLEAQVEELEEAIETNTSLKASLENSITALTAKKNTYQGTVTGLTAELSNLRSRLAELGTSEAELKERDTINATIPLIETDITDYSNRVTLTENQITVTYEEIDQATIDLELAKATYNTVVIGDLREQAQNYLNVNKFPQINYDLEAHLNGVLEIGDIIHVKHPDMRVDLLTGVTAYKWNCLTGKFDQVVFGTLKPTLKGKIAEVEEKIEDVKEDTEKINQRITKYSSEYKRDNRELVSKFMSEVYGESDGIYGLIEKNSSLFRQTASSITAQVTQVDRNLTSKVATLEIKANGISATVSANYNSLSQDISSVNIKANSIQSTVTRIDGDLTTAKSTITQQATAINLRVEKNKVINEINLSTEGAKISVNKLDVSGLVTITNLQTAGQTIINGGNITTGTLDCSKITVTNLNAGSITTGNLNATRISGGTLNFNNITVSNLSADYITTGILSAARISGGTLDCSKITVSNLNANSITSGALDVNYVKMNDYLIMNQGSASNYLKIGGTSYQYATGVEIGATTFKVLSQYLGFFGGSGSTKKAVSTISTSAETSETNSKLNELINALKGYNLV